ncbi:hypothetical protein [Amycolatopsis vastitatis]|uniref:hypothetical protein n=1 Tax=Amycolatopsis vastitatis TaxID=1905142 RepID=UPI001177E038|nr:hypothetical protein [Amycolatopsis vastitatis]
MTNDPRSASKKNSATSKRVATKNKIQYGNGDILAVSAVLLIIIGLYFFARSTSSLAQIFTGPLNVFFLPSIPALLIALFGGLYLYRVIRRDPLGRIPLVVASIFSVALIIVGLVFLTVLLGAGTTCPISSNPHQDCGQLNAFMLYVYVNNPIVYGLAMILAVVGSVSLLGRGRKN